MSPYVDPQTIHNPATGAVAPASWGDCVRDDLEFLISPPQCSFSHSTTQNVADSTWVSLSGNTENYDTDTMHSTVTNNSRCTITTAGKYLFIALAEVGAHATGHRSMRLLVNGATVYELANQVAITGASTRLGGSRTLALAAADYVEAQVWQNSGGTRTGQLVELSAQFTSR